MTTKGSQGRDHFGLPIPGVAEGGEPVDPNYGADVTNPIYNRIAGDASTGSWPFLFVRQILDEGTQLKFRPSLNFTGPAITATDTGQVTNIAVSGHMPGAVVRNNAGYTTVTATPFTCTFNTEDIDLDNMHSTVSNTSRLTCVTSGMYVVTGSVEWAGNATGVRTVTIMKNGTTNYAANTMTAGSASILRQNISMVMTLTATDYVELQVTQNSGGNLAINVAANFSPTFAAQMMSY